MPTLVRNEPARARRKSGGWYGWNAGTREKDWQKDWRQEYEDAVKAGIQVGLSAQGGGDPDGKGGLGGLGNGKASGKGKGIPWDEDDQQKVAKGK